MFSCCPRITGFFIAMLLGSAIFAAGALFTSRNASMGAHAGGLMPVAFSPDATSNGKSISVATGVIDESVEGIFVLDHLTGNLQCWIMNARSGEVGGVFRGNVLEALGLQGKNELDYVMATGRFDFSNFRKGNLRYADCICYVGESSSGKIIGYSLTYDPTTGARGKPQGGELIVVATIPFRDESVIRDKD